MANNIKAFVLDRIQKNHKLPEDVNIEEFNYIDSGYVDSMGLMRFIIEIEKEFNIEITDKDMESKGFKTIGGLISIIKDKLVCK